MVLTLSLVMGACSSSDDTDDATPTKDKSDITTPDKEETITVTFDLNYVGATDTPSAQTIKKDDKATKPTDPTRDGYTFDNWYTDEATTKVFAFTTPITKAITLYAGWAIKTYTVTFDLGGGTGTVPEQSIPKDDNATKPNATDNPTRDGYTFDNWYKKQDGSGTAFAFDTTPITGDTKLYAKWTAIITYTVTFDGNYDGAAAPTTVTVEHGKTTTKPANPTRDGYTFDNWYTDEAMTKVFVFTTLITADITLYAKWICPAREARETLTHVVSLYDQGEADAPYLPEALRRDFAVEPSKSILLFSSTWEHQK